MEKEVDMSPVAAQEFKAWLEAEYAEAQGPFTAEKIGAPEFVIMHTSDLEEGQLTDDEMAIMHGGFEAAQCGEAQDAREAVAEIRVARGL